MRSTSSRRGLLRFTLAALALLLVTTGCGLLTLPEPTATATPAPTETPLPTSTPTQTATPEPTETPTPTATPDRAATAQAAATQTAEKALAWMAEELAAAGVQDGEGHLVWASDTPKPMTLTDYNSFLSFPVARGEGPYKNFVLHSDIRWDSTSGLAGCGFIFRAEDDLQFGAYYVLSMLRLSGLPAWDIEYYRYGDWQYTLGDVRYTDAINQKSDAINQVTLIVRGDTYKVIINGKEMRPDSDNKLKDGDIHLITWQESGKSTCVFDNSWLWSLDDAE